MKKIVGILGMAAVLASGAFAAEPKADFKIAEFTGSADFGWKADFKDTDNLAAGFYNDASANLKLGFITAGDKTTAGDGIWGELKIKVGDTSVSNGKIKLGNYGDANEDGFADYNGPTDCIATDKDAEGKKTDEWLVLPNLFPAASVDTAKIHFVDGDFAVALNILAPGLAYDGYAPFVAVPSGVAATGINANPKYHNKNESGTVVAGWNTQLTNGFGLEIAMKDMFGFNFKLMDNGVKDIDYKAFGMAMDASLKAVKNLDARVAAAFNFDTEYVGFLADAAYKFPLEALSDKTYVKAGAGYSYNNSKTLENKKAIDVNSVSVGAMFGWGAEGQKPELDQLATASDKFNEGVSVAVNNNLVFDDVKSEDFDMTKPLAKANVTKLAVGLYDASLFKFLGIEDFGTLKTGIENVTTFSNVNVTGKAGDKTVKTTTSAVANDFVYSTKFDSKLSIFDIALHGSVKLAGNLTMNAKVSGVDNADTIAENTNKYLDTLEKEAKPVFTYGVTIGTKEIIDNTNVYVSYEGAYDDTLAKNKVTKSEVKIGTKISF